MDRFFSKLDLRDIKIDPERMRFSPDDDLQTEDGHAAAPAAPSDESPWQEASRFESAPAATLEAPSIGEDGVPDLAPTPESGEVLKVSSKSRPSAVAGAIAGVVRELGRAEVQAIGAGATNQAVKAVAIARDYLLDSGIDAVCLPAFIDITIDNEDRTAIRLVIEPR